MMTVRRDCNCRCGSTIKMWCFIPLLHHGRADFGRFSATIPDSIDWISSRWQQPYQQALTSFASENKIYRKEARKKEAKEKPFSAELSDNSKNLRDKKSKSMFLTFNFIFRTMFFFVFFSKYFRYWIDIPFTYLFCCC